MKSSRNYSRSPGKSKQLWLESFLQVKYSKFAWISAFSSSLLFLFWFLLGRITEEDQDSLADAFGKFRDKSILEPVGSLDMSFNKALEGNEVHPIPSRLTPLVWRDRES